MDARQIVCVGTGPLGQNGLERRLVGIKVGGPAYEDIIAFQSLKLVGAYSTDQDITAHPARERVVAGTADKDVARIAALQQIVSSAAVLERCQPRSRNRGLIVAVASVEKEQAWVGKR